MGGRRRAYSTWFQFWFWFQLRISTHFLSSHASRVCNIHDCECECVCVCMCVFPQQPRPLQTPPTPPSPAPCLSEVIGLAAHFEICRASLVMFRYIEINYKQRMPLPLPPQETKHVYSLPYHTPFLCPSLPLCILTFHILVSYLM